MSWFASLFAPRVVQKNAAPVFFTNTLSGKREVFSPRKAGMVSMYSCGPTVYSKQHIGNLKAPLFADLVARVLIEAGYRVRRVINITDVGHLVSNADEGEDKMELGAQREGMHAHAIAKRYTDLFLLDLEGLGIDTTSILFPKATDYIKEQIAMVRILEEKGFTYRTGDGIYFDTSRFPAYGKLGNLGRSDTREEALASLGRRISENKEKKHPADFALWKFSPAGSRREQEWSSPWGRGFPGWHIECSAMAKTLLGPEIDIHTGGVDHIPVHHNNEIAQSESANGCPLARFWMHEAFVTLADEKISKSLGNDVYLSDIVERGFHPLSLRYFFLQAHYSTPLSFSFEALGAAQEGLTRLWRHARRVLKEAKGKARTTERSRSITALLREDLGTPQALALLWEVLKDEDAEPSEQLAALQAGEAVLGLSLLSPPPISESLPEDVRALVIEREKARAGKDFSASDALRIHIQNRGYHVEDGPSGPIVTRLPG